MILCFWSTLASVFLPYVEGYEGSIWFWSLIMFWFMTFLWIPIPNKFHESHEVPTLNIKTYPCMFDYHFLISHVLFWCVVWRHFVCVCRRFMPWWVLIPSQLKLSLNKIMGFATWLAIGILSCIEHLSKLWLLNELWTNCIICNSLYMKTCICWKWVQLYATTLQVGCPCKVSCPKYSQTNIMFTWLFTHPFMNKICWCTL